MPATEEEMVVGQEEPEESEGRGIRVSVCVPTHNKAHSLFAYDLANMMGFLGSGPVAQGILDSVSLNFVTGTYVHTARQELAEAALAQESDFVLFLDSDMRFPKDTLIQLLQHNEPIVGINYSTRGMPPHFVAVKEVGWDDEDDAVRCKTDQESTGLEEVEAIGFGAVLIRTDVLLSLPNPRENGPWFWYEWREELGNQVGEDVYFCQLAREAGFPIYVDHDLSRRCAHIGDFEFQTDAVSSFLGGDE